MNRKNIAVLAGAVLLLSAVATGFVLAQSSAEDILVMTLETMETIDDGHAILAVDVDSVEYQGSVTVEIWGRHDQDGIPTAFERIWGRAARGGSGVGRGVGRCGLSIFGEHGHGGGESRGGRNLRRSDNSR